MPTQQSRRLLWVVFGIVACVRVTLVQAQDPSPKQEAINLLQQAGQLVDQIPEPQRMSAAANIGGQLAVAGDFSGALAMARSLTRPQDRGAALGSIAYSLDYQGRQEEALQLLSEVSSEQAGTRKIAGCGQPSADIRCRAHALRFRDLTDQLAGLPE